VFNITGCTYNITQGISYTDSSSSSDPSVNETAIGSATAFDAEAYYKACSAVSNATAGTIINPVQSARLSTRKTASMKFGRIEVTAKIPTGDWLWPGMIGKRLYFAKNEFGADVFLTSDMAFAC
jgi:hypothetical protein